MGPKGVTLRRENEEEIVSEGDEQSVVHFYYRIRTVFVAFGDVVVWRLTRRVALISFAYPTLYFLVAFGDTH